MSTEESAETRLIWRFLGRILSDPKDPDAVDGREYFEAHADPDGNVRRKEFLEIVSTVFKCMLTNSGALESLAQRAWKYFSVLDSSLSTKDSAADVRFLIFKKHCVAKLDDLFPIVAQALFRFFDVDGSDAVTKEEFVAGMTFLKTFEQNVSSESVRLEPILKAVFRLLDQNGNGSVEPSELSNFFLDLTNSFCNLLSGILEEFGPYLVEGPLRNVFDTYANSKGFGNFSSGFYETIYQEEAWTLIEGVMGIFDKDIPALPRDLLEAVASGVDWSSPAAEFLKDFKERATNDELPKIEVCRLANQHFMPLTLQNLTDQLSVGVKIARDRLLAVSNEIDDTILTDAIIQTVSTFRMYIKAGGNKRVILALLTCLDADNNEIINLQELTQLWEAGSDLYQFLKTGGPKEAFIPKFKALFTAVWFLTDANGDGVLSVNEVYQVAVKVFDLLLEMAGSVIHAGRSVFSCIFLPLSLLAFDIKAKKFGTSPYDFTHEDLKQICAIASSA